MLRPFDIWDGGMPLYTIVNFSRNILTISARLAGLHTIMIVNLSSGNLPADPVCLLFNFDWRPMRFVGMQALLSKAIEILELLRCIF